MNYGNTVLDKVTSPGFILVLLGAVMAYASRLLTRDLPAEKQERANIIVKIAGCVLAFAGAIMLFLQG